MADRPVRAAARPRQLPQQRRRRAAQHGPAVAQRLPRPRCRSAFFLVVDGGRGLRRRARAARARRRGRARRRRRRLDPGRRHRDDPARAARLAAVGDVRLRRAVPPAPRAHAAGARTSCSPASRSAIAFGTKWYGVSSVAVLVVVWIAARLLRAREAPTPARCATALLVGALALLGDAAWLARNLVESGNPVFPVKVAPFGVTIFDAPPDVIREPGRLQHRRLRRRPAGPAPARGRDRRRPRPAAPIVCARRRSLAAAIVAPPRAADRRDRAADRRRASRSAPRLRVRCPAPRSACAATRRSRSGNTRYAVPVAACSPCRSSRGRSGACRASPARRRSRRAARPPSLTGALQRLRGRTARATSCSPRSALAALAAARLGAVAPARRGASCSSRPPSRPRSSASPPAHRIEQRINDGRYLGVDPRDRRAAARRAGGQADRPRRRLVGRRPVAGLAGLRHADRQRRRVRRLLRRRLPDAATADAARFQDGAARAARYDVLVVGRGFYPPQAHARAALGDRRRLAHDRAQPAPARARPARAEPAASSPR